MFPQNQRGEGGTGMPFLLMSGTPSKVSSSPLETVLVEVGWKLFCDNRRLEWVLGPHFRVVGQPYLFKVINTLPVSCCFNGIGQPFFFFCPYLYLAQEVREEGAL